MRRHWPSLVLLFALGCAGQPAKPAVDVQAEQEALMQADKAWFESHADAETFLAFFSEDAVFLPEGAPAARGESIRSTWEHLIATPGFHLEWLANSAKVAEAGDLGYTTGTYELTVAPEGTAMTTVGKYVTVWKKQSDGTWKVAVDCFNSDGPPSAGE